MKTKNLLLTALLATSLMITCEAISAQSSFNTKVYYAGSNLEQVLGIKFNELSTWKAKMTNELKSEKSSDAFVVDLSSLEKDIRFNPSNIETTDVDQPEVSMEDIVKELYKDTKFNPADYLEKE